ncbi:DnaD domain protein [Mycoplasmopsis cynos]|uniref:DnaD domain protein n=1 Tax=Mycoplasmopsis cynos TaxID=171284 RepID=UPI0024C7DFD5|nr:DnaD domain protein [Mycoplasmopsis cynos]WAM10533.1 DnaD domain protein [Mycoplasmopsis cynos]
MLQRNENEIELLQLKKWLDINFESKTLNMIIFYAIKRRGDSWYKYVNSLISELNANNITNFDDVEKYLDGKFKSNVKTKIYLWWKNYFKITISITIKIWLNLMN